MINWLLGPNSHLLTPFVPNAANVSNPHFPATQSQAVDFKATNGGKARFGRKADLGQLSKAAAASPDVVPAQRPTALAGRNCAYGIFAKAEARMGGPVLDNPDLPLQQVFLRWPEVAAVFHLRGMACFGCPITPFHTVIDACAEYGLDEAAFLTALQAAVAD